MYFNVMVLLAFLIGQRSVDGITSLASLPAKEEVIVPKTCTMERVYRLIGYDCSKMDLKDIPQTLKTSLEVFDVSFNRIRELSKKSFARYSDLKYLYLFDNMIQYIEKGTFEHLTSLEAIDLSINALSTISMDLFYLPRLRNLYYSHNGLIHLDSDLKKLDKPIVAPLQKISIDGCRLRSLPDFGILPDLVVLNVSLNPFNEITPQQFSPFCSLTSVSIENSTELSPCMCKSLKIYFDQRHIVIRDLFDCPTFHEEEVYCLQGVNATVDGPEYNSCLEKVMDKKKTEESKRAWLITFCALGGFFVLFIGVLYYLHRRNANKQEQESKQMTKLRHIHQTENGNVEVLLARKT